MLSAVGGVGTRKGAGTERPQLPNIDNSEAVVRSPRRKVGYA